MTVFCRIVRPNAGGLYVDELPTWWCREAAPLGDADVESDEIVGV